MNPITTQSEIHTALYLFDLDKSDNFSPTMVFYESLTPKEYEVLEYITKGMKNIEIANEMNVAKSTISGYRESLFSKLNVSSPEEAVYVAMKLKLIN